MEKMNRLQFHKLLHNHKNKLVANKLAASKLIALLLTVLFSHQVFADKKETSDYLNSKIHSLYTGLQDSKKVLSVAEYPVLPTDTILDFLGQYPSRHGFVVTKVFFQPAPGNRKTSITRSLTLEFNGPVLSKMILDVTVDDATDYRTTTIRLIDPTPMDKNYSDWTLIKKVDGLGDPIQFTSLDEQSDFVLNFKRNYAVKLLEEFQLIIDVIYSKKPEHPVKEVMKNMDNLLD